MKLTVIILFTAILHVTASSYGQKITIKQKDANLQTIFNEINKQSGYFFLYKKALIENTPRVNIDIKNGSLEDALTACFAGQNLTYKITNKAIIVSQKNVLEESVDKIKSFFLNIDVHGRVVDENGKGLAGATVTIVSTGRAIVTGSNGDFVLHDVEEGAALEITYLGYEPRKAPAIKNLGSITLTLKSGKLQEVEINAGYYTVTDRERTGNISKITSETIEKQPINNTLMALQGRVPGLQITQETGVPGGGFNVQIRGQNSINSGNDPLYIIDGVNYPSTRISGVSNQILGNTGASPLSMLNPNDIESIEVLKDADATAIYGSRGANGVILITTKKGKEGVMKITAQVNQGFSEVAHKIDVLNTQQYLQMRNEALKNDGLQVGSTDYDINGTYDQNKDTDWQKKLIGNKSFTTNTSLSISGGTTKSNYLIAGNYYKEGTVYPGAFGYNRLGIRSNVNLESSNSKFQVSFDANYNHTQSNLISTDLTSNILLPPNQPDPYDEFGKLTWNNNTVINNPLALLLQTYNAGTENLVGNLSLSYNIVKNLVLKTSIGYTSIKRDEIQKTPLASIAPIFGYTAAQRASVFSNNYNDTFLAEPTLTYTVKKNIGTFNALVGMSFQNNIYQLSSTNASGFTSDDLMDNLGSASLLSNFTNNSQYKYSAGFTRLNYNFADKYYVNLTARRDGSSKFGPGKQFANFGAVGTAWIFTDENFIKDNLSFLSFGKIRASYGITGNDQIANYAYLQLWNTNSTYNGVATITPGSNAPNNDFAWETNKKLEGAIQLGFFKNRINFEASFYRNRSSNQLLSKALPLSTGLGGIIQNLPAEVQNKGWEFTTDIKVLNYSNFQWTLGMNLTIPKNKLLSYPGLENSSDAANYQIGEPLSIFKAYNVTVDKQTGLYTFEDKDGKGALDDGNRYIIKFLGQTSYGGVQNSFKYKQFNLDFFFTFTKQNGRSFITTADQQPGNWSLDTPVGNQYSIVLNRWQNFGDNTSIQRFGTTSDTNLPYLYTKYYGNISVVNASYIRLKNISLSYSFPKNWLSLLKISNATVSIQGQNIFTITNYIGLDPETQGNVLPPLRTLMMGLSFTF